MSDIKLFEFSNGQLLEITAKQAKLEKDLQMLIENNMEVFLGVRFLASEFSTSNGGRIDSLGLDENNCPVIVEYKRSKNQNVINQGLFYYDWLLDHQGEFQLLVMGQLDSDLGESIEWSGARLICIASDFTRYDEHAIKQIDRNIELIRYKFFGDSLIVLELVNTSTSRKLSTPILESDHTIDAPSSMSKVNGRNDTHEGRKAAAGDQLLNMYEEICAFGMSLGDEIQRKELKFYTALKKIRNFASIQVWAPQRDPSLRIYLPLTPSSVGLEEGFSFDATNKGHWGTGDLELIVRTPGDLEKAKLLMEHSFEKN